MAEWNEEARLAALYRLNLLDTPTSESFDRITRMASQLFQLPIAAVSLTDHDRQWFKSRVGVSHSSITRDRAPCAEVAETAEFLLVPDLLEHPRYRESPLAEQGIRFYAGASLTTREGYSLGALCVLGTEPRGASDAEVGALSDLAKMVMDQIELQHAFGRIDPVSGLPNRNQFVEDMSDLGRDSPGERRLVVLVDLARSEQLSAGMRVMGSAYLDEVVRDTAATIVEAIGPDRTAYHVAATQFAFLAKPDVDEASYTELLAGMLARFRLESKARFVMTSSIGVAPLVAGHSDPASVLRAAHSAAEDARSSANCVRHYSLSVDEVHRRRFRLLNDFGEALDSGSQLSLAFQPRIDLRSGACVGVEALLRWHHPELGEVSPAEFIPVIEQTALVGPTTAWVLDQALAQVRRWRDRGIDVQVAINVSTNNLTEPDFAQQVQLYLLKHRLPTSALEIEVTESAMMQDVDQAMVQITALSEIGVQIAIDDFGTGYSSLAYLQRLPARVLKIDRSFVQNLGQGERERRLVGSMISLAHGLGYRVVAEGVETESVRSALETMACDEGQGYLFGRPMAVDRFEDWFAAQRPAAAARAA